MSHCRLSQCLCCHPNEILCNHRMRVFYNVRIMAILAIVPFRVTYELRAVIAVVGVTPWDYCGVTWTKKAVMLLYWCRISVLNILISLPLTWYNSRYLPRTGLQRDQGVLSIAHICHIYVFSSFQSRKCSCLLQFINLTQALINKYWCPILKSNT